MSTPDEHNQTSETPLSTAQAPMQAAQMETEAVQAPVQAEDDIAIDDSNSAYSNDISTYTTSLSTSALNFPTENGRRYHAFREGTYVFPNDELEQDRMDIHHEMTLRACGGKLHLAPLTNPRRILDIGTGTGIWCIEMGDTYPDAEVIGNDFSPVQPNLVPRNVRFEVDDVEAPWTHPTKFDYIHCRFMAGSIADWPKLVQTCYNNLNPGGIAEFQDGDFLAYSEDGSSKDSWLEKWNIDFEKAARTGGRIVRPGRHLEDWVRAAGFEDVHHEKIRLPIGLWPKDRQMASNISGVYPELSEEPQLIYSRKQKDVGAFNLVQLKEGLEGFSLALFTRILGWAPEEVQVLLSKVRKDLDNRNIHAQNDMHIAWGRRTSA